MSNLRNSRNRKGNRGKRSIRWRYAALAASAAMFTFAVPSAHAQGSGEITGTVTDPSGAIIPKAQVTLTSQATGEARNVPTNSAGLFDFTGLDAGKYNLTVKVSGFSAYKRADIVMNVAQTLKEDVALQAGSEGTTVTVEADALQVQTETNEVSTLITGQQMVQLATNGRNVIGLTSLGTGVATTNPSFNGVTAQGSSFNLSFNGMRPDHNNWLIDGGEVYDRGSGGKLDVMPSPDMLDEFQVLSSNYTPDYGISSGGTVSMVLKQGTKSFHGAAWEFNRNDLFDANNYFNKNSGTPLKKPELRLNIFGGDIGGPVRIPHLYNDSLTKTFFFAGEEWRRYIQGAQPSQQATPPAADYPTTATGDLAYTPFGSDLQQTPSNLHTCANGASGYGLLCVPVTADAQESALIAGAGLVQGNPFPRNSAGQQVIPGALLDKNALAYLPKTGVGAIPLPTDGGTNFLASPKQPTFVREDVVRVDHNFTDKYHLLGSWIHDSMSQTIIPTQWSGDSYSTVGDVFSNPSWAAVVKLSQQLTPTLLNETALNVNGNVINVTPTGIYQQPSGFNAGSLFTGNNALNRLPQIGFGGGPLNTTYTAIYWPWHNSFLDYQLRDDISKIAGKHALKAGFSYMRMDKNQQLQADTEGDYSFNGSGFTQNSWINFLTGFASSYSQLQQQRTNHYVNNTYSLYAQDDWHTTQRLTLNLGVRYDVLPHVFEKNNQLGNFNPAHYVAGSTTAITTINGAQFYTNGIDLAGQNGVPRGLVNNDYFNIQPRLGFAMDLKGDGKSVLRGGAGMFYERVQGNDTYNIANTPPFAFDPTLNNVFLTRPTVSSVTGAAQAAGVQQGAGLTNLAQYYPNPATFQYSLGIQQQIAPSVVFLLGYVGTSGWNQDDLREINDLGLNAPVALRQQVATSKIDVNTVRPYQGYSNIRQEENGVNFHYNSLQASMRMEAKHGLTLQFSYTWSHEIDIQSADLTSVNLAGSGNGALSNPYNPRYDYGSGGFDRRNIFNANYIYVLPFYQHSSNGLLRTTLGGWQVAGVTVAESGVPVNIYYNGPDTVGLGGNTNPRPDVVGPISYPKTQAQWFNTAAFAAPLAPWAGGTTNGFGNARKDDIVGPGLFNWNLSLYKDILLTSHEGPRIQLRAESYNTFNHTEFNNIDTGFTDGNYGRVTSTYDPRSLQFGAKFLF